MEEKKLDFLIVGAMKSGTDYLQKILFQHPEIAMPDYELSFFNRNDAYSKGIKYYMEKFENYKTSRTKIVGEKTPGYGNRHTKAAEKISINFPEAKIVWILRNPVDRAYSHYWHACKQLKEVRSFDAAVKDELEGRVNIDQSSYLDRGRYIKDIEYFQRYFNFRNNHFIVFEEFKLHEEKQIEDLLRFLGVSQIKLFANKEASKNQTIVPRFYTLMAGIKNQFGVESIAFKAANKLSKINKKPGYANMNDQTRQLLVSFYEEDNRKLSELVGVDLDKLWNH